MIKKKKKLVWIKSGGQNQRDSNAIKSKSREDRTYNNIQNSKNNFQWKKQDQNLNF